jgi:hypothetical protein
MEPGEVSFDNSVGSPLENGNPPRVAARAGKLALISFLAPVLVSMWLAVPAPAKQKGPTVKTVSGVVIDDAENFIQGAMIELKDLQTGKVLDIYSQAGGQYQFTDLRFDHDYTVQATYNDVSSEVRQVSSIDTRARLTLNLVIPKTK